MPCNGFYESPGGYGKACIKVELHGSGVPFGGVQSDGCVAMRPYMLHPPTEQRSAETLALSAAAYKEVVYLGADA